MDEPAEIACDNGVAVVFTLRSPAKETVNEDACCIYRTDSSACVLLVADGMGGLPNGQAASALVVTSIEKFLAASPDESKYRDAILDGIEDANKQIMQEAPGSGSTVALVEIVGNLLRPYHVGDSKILVVGQRGKIKLETLSHSPTEYAIEAGYLEPRDAMDHEDRRYVSNMLGAGDMRIELGAPLRLSKFDTVLIASDGLIDNLHLEEIVEIIRKGKLKKCMQTLIRLCRKRMMGEGNPGEPSAPDDLTILLFRMGRMAVTLENF